MELSDVVRVEELTHYVVVNDYLALGWKLLDIYKTAADYVLPASNHQTPHYILGWINGEPKYPEKDDPVW